MSQWNQLDSCRGKLKQVKIIYSLLWALFNGKSLLGLKFDKVEVWLPTVEFLDLVWK